MKKYLFSVVAAIGMMVAYQSYNMNAKARPIIEIGPLCMEVTESTCEYEYVIGDFYYFDIMEGRLYGNKN